MKATAPDKIYIPTILAANTVIYKVEGPIEYTRTDAFIEKACKKLEKCMYDNLMFQGRLHRKEVIETFIDDFKKAMEERV